MSDLANKAEGSLRIRSGSTVNLICGETHVGSDQANFRIDND